MTSQTKDISVVAVYDTHTGAEAAFQALRRAGFDANQLSLLGKDLVSEATAGRAGEAGDVAGAELGEAMTGLGIPAASISAHEIDVDAGKYVVVATGTADMIDRAHALLGTTGASHVAAHVAANAKDEARADYMIRDAILALLSDAEIASVSTAEGSVVLADGDEYVDLERLTTGVRRASGALTPMGRVLPRSAVEAATWTKIVRELTLPRL